MSGEDGGTAVVSGSHSHTGTLLEGIYSKTSLVRTPVSHGVS